jgi:hypothetical protein
MKVGASEEVGSSSSSGAIAPFNLEVFKFPPVFTNVRPRMQLGILRLLLRREAKKASCIWFSGCKPCIHGNTCSGFGSGCVAICSNASAIRSAVIVYTGGSSEYSVQYVSGGYVMEDVSMRLSCRGGEAGGVTGSPPGEHIGMCLLGMAAGVPRVDVLSDRCCGGVDDRVGIDIALATAAAMLAVGARDVQVQLKARNVSTCAICAKRIGNWAGRCFHGSNRLDVIVLSFLNKTIQWPRSEY